MIRLTLGVLLLSTANLFAQDTITDRIKIEPLCFFEQNGTFFINSIEEYSSMIENYVTAENKDCFTNYKFMDVDFEKYSILGFTNNVNGCTSANTSFTVTKSGEGYKVAVNSIATEVCNDGVYICEWYLYPKIKWRFDVTWDSNVKYSITE